MEGSRTTERQRPRLRPSARGPTIEEFPPVDDLSDQNMALLIACREQLEHRRTRFAPNQSLGWSLAIVVSIMTSAYDVVGSIMGGFLLSEGYAWFKVRQIRAGWPALAQNSERLAARVSDLYLVSVTVVQAGFPVAFLVAGAPTGRTIVATIAVWIVGYSSAAAALLPGLSVRTWFISFLTAAAIVVWFVVVVDEPNTELALVVFVVATTVGSLINLLQSNERHRHATEQRVELIRTTRRLERSVAFEHQLFAAINHGIAVIDDDQLVERSNPAAKSMLQLSGVALPIPHDVIEAARATGTQEWRAEDGSIFALSVQPFEFDDGGPELLTIVDITERDKAEALRLHDHKLVALGTLAGGVAHEINNMLMVVSGTTALLAGRLEPVAQKADRAMLEGAETAVTRMSELARQLLDFSRREVDGSRELVPPTELVQSVIDITERTITNQVRLVTEGDIGPILTYPQLMEPALLNVVLNARDASDPNQPITIAVVGDDDGVRFVISDEGVGVPDDILDRLTEPFFSTKPRGVGTGLGLATTQNYVEQCGGTLSIESTEGVGTSVTIFLPSVEDAPVGPALVATEDPSFEGLSLLVVDDEELVLEVLAAELRYRGHRW